MRRQITETEVGVIDRPAARPRFDLSGFLEESREALFRYGVSLCHCVDLADDLIQETFIRALSHVGLLKGLNPYQREAWLKRVLRNLYFDERRKARRRQEQLSRLEAEVRRNESSMPFPDLDEILCEAPPQHAGLLVMRFRLGMNSVEIGNELGIPAATVRSRLHQAIRRLRSRFEASAGKEL